MIRLAPSLLIRAEDVVLGLARFDAVIGELLATETAAAIAG